MAHQQAYRAAADGKRPVNKASGLAETFAYSRRLAFAAAAFFAASTAVGHAQSGPFAGMAGNWAGGGRVIYYKQVKGLVAEDIPDERLA